MRRINKENPQKNWYHFGDIDPDGFYILEHLRKGTGIDFEPFRMSVNELRNYVQHCKELSDKDKVKAGNLISRGRYVETLQYMLDNNCKLEQEIISISHRGDWGKKNTFTPHFTPNSHKNMKLYKKI